VEKNYPLKMPIELHKAIKTAAAQSGKTMNEIIVELTSKALGVGGPKA
jgi:predicted HicB family RNase H-like nuclease